MKRVIRIVVYVLVVLLLLVFAWLKSIEVDRLKTENEQLFDKLNLQNESADNEVQAYKDTLRTIREEL